MNLSNKAINTVLSVSFILLISGVFLMVLLMFLQPLPNIASYNVGDNLFIKDDLPQNCRIIGIDVTSDDNIYLHTGKQTLWFDENGEFKGKFVYYSHGTSFFAPIESSDCFWIYFAGSEDKYLCNPQGDILRIERKQKNDLIYSEYKLEITDSNGNTYYVKRFLCFSRVIGPDGRTFYTQSFIFKVCCILIFISSVLTVLFAIFKFKKENLHFYLDRWQIRIKKDDS